MIPILNNLAVAENAAVSAKLLKLVSDGLVFLSILGAIGSVAICNTYILAETQELKIILWLNFGLHSVLTIVWIISEHMKSEGNHSGHSQAVLSFGIIYIILFILDIVTAIIMIFAGVGFIIGA